MTGRVRTFQFAPRTWIGWFLTVVIGLTLLAVAAVFVTAALIAGFVIATVVLARVWWLMRKMKRQHDTRYLSAEYQVEREEVVSVRDRTADRTPSRDDTRGRG